MYYRISVNSSKKEAILLKVIKSVAKTLPFVPAAYEAYWNRRRSRMPTQQIFRDVFQKNTWQGIDSVSGPGSELGQTKAIIAALPELLREFGVATLLDMPCGDFHWMRLVDLHNIRYIGADIVDELVCHNKKYESDNVSFVHANLLFDNLPEVDLVLCRDCLVHFSFADIYRSFRNIVESGSKYLLTTTFPEVRTNRDITTGGWRPLNLQIEPLNLPMPLRFLVEGAGETNGQFKDKSLGLWRVRDIRDCIKGC